MAYGVPPKNSHTLPPGRRAFTDEPGLVKHEIIRPGRTADSQSRDGTPPGTMHTTAATARYTDAASRKYRNALRGIGDRGLSGGNYGQSENPTVHSKGRKNDARFGKFGLDSPTHRSVGEQPAPLQRGSELAARLKGRDVSKAGVIKAQVVGHAPDGSGRFIEATHPNSSKRKHTGQVPSSPRVADAAPLDRASYGQGKYPGPR